MLRKAASKGLWLIKGAALFWGSVMTLALVFGVASMALGANGGNFILGKNNSATALSRLTGNVQGAAMQVITNNPGADDTALNLQVQDGEAPMRVNSDTRVTNLNADKIDGKDSAAFFSGKTYVVTDRRLGPGGGGLVNRSEFCDAGDQVLGGGTGIEGEGDEPLSSTPVEGTTDDDGWFVSAIDNGAASFVSVRAVCADFPPLRP